MIDCLNLKLQAFSLSSCFGNLAIYLHNIKGDWRKCLFCIIRQLINTFSRLCKRLEDRFPIFLI